MNPEQSSDTTLRSITDTHPAIFDASLSVKETVMQLKEFAKQKFFTYGFVLNSDHRLIGVVVMRDLLFADPTVPLESVMIKDPFYLTDSMEIMDAAKLAVKRHYPEYPVCDENGRFIGSVRGEKIFEVQAFEISAQAGSMVGVEKEERLSTSWQRSFKLRHPWLQVNLFTAFLAGGVVSYFQGTIDKLVILAVFLPILAGQSGNTGCQALAVTLRGLTLGDLNPSDAPKLIFKEAFLGLLNGTFVGFTAGLGMFFLAKSQGNPDALVLGLLVMTAMVGSCVVSGISGALVPLTLKKFGADPATASSIFLTTMTDITSMGMLLSLASLILL